MRRRTSTTIALLIASVAALCATSVSGVARAAAAPTIKITGNHFVDGAGHTIQFRGVNAPAAAVACVEPNYDQYRTSRFSSGPTDDAAIEAMLTWKPNIVRVGLNEDCWLGINPVKAGKNKVTPIKGSKAVQAGEALKTSYRAALTDYVQRLHAKGLVVILDLHWTAPGKTLASDQWQLPDADHTPALWSSVAETFKDDHSTIFEIFNEPNAFHDEQARNTSAADWDCLLHGCAGILNGPLGGKKTHGTYTSAGTQSLVDAIRTAGATQPILVPGLNDTNDLSQWEAHLPNDPANQLAAALHVYGPTETDPDAAYCNSIACLDRVVKPIAQTHPVVTTEFNEFDCEAGFVNAYMQWADANGVSYLGWVWDLADPDFKTGVVDCHNTVLISDFSGAPFGTKGQAVHDHFIARAAS